MATLSTVRIEVPPAEVAVTPTLARRLLRDQHRDLAHLPLRRLGSGWDTEVLRLGRDLVVRLPRRQLGARLLGSELRWLPELAPRLPLPVPVPVRAGEPGQGYPWPWAVCRYVPGRPVAADRLRGRAGMEAAGVLGEFLVALHRPAPADAPRNPYRGGPLAQRDDALMAALPALDDLPGLAGARGRVLRTWQSAVAAPAHPGPVTWLHADLHGLNVLVARGRVTGVVDFGDLCAGDPATDLAVAWLLLDGPARELLRARLGADDAAWSRGRGWALYLAVMFARHSARAPLNALVAQDGLAEILADPP